MYNRTTYGYWWSATRSAATGANSLHTGTSDVSSQHSYLRGYGFALRCVASKREVAYGSKLGASVPNYNRINEWPLQFLRTGHYRRSYGYLYARTTAGHWWSSAASSATNGHNLGTWTGNVYAQDSNFRGAGFALRCGETTKKYSLWGCTF